MSDRYANGRKMMAEIKKKYSTLSYFKAKKNVYITHIYST